MTLVSTTVPATSLASLAMPTTVAALPMRINNFDLIRLCAASQVMLDHGLVHLNVTSLAVVWAMIETTLKLRASRGTS